MKDNTKQTEIQTHICQKPLTIVECFPVFKCYNIAHAQSSHCRRSCSDSMDFITECFPEACKIDVTLLLSGIYYY